MAAGDPRHLGDAGDLARLQIHILCILSIPDLEKFSAPLREHRKLKVNLSRATANPNNRSIEYKKLVSNGFTFRFAFFRYTQNGKNGSIFRIW